MVNYWLVAAAAVALAAVSLHIYTMEVWIWPNLNVVGFPAFPFGSKMVDKGFYRTVWHFFTVNWLLTIGTLIPVAFGHLAPYGITLVWFLMVFWMLIVVEIFIIAALSLQPGDSYIKTMIHAFQWTIIVGMVALMYLGVRS